ncbi:MAG: AmmeMemoRadiSam system protein B [Planctomycetota bacterium]|nr:AmmeMemoRadiSam system protein B [Planctomycetota bacterium]
MGSGREAIHAGTWYEGTEQGLKKRMSKWITAKEPSEGEAAFAVIVPHAGYIYSGEVAAVAYNSVKIPMTVLILNPNHRGIGAPLALYPEGAWETPLGDVPIDVELNHILLSNTSVVEDERAHIYEHSGELQVPFLKYRRNDLKISVICISSEELETMQQLGEGIAKSLKQFNGEVLIVASSDLTHYEPQKVAERKDRAVIERIEALDPDGLWDTVERQRISMCGVAPVTATLFAARKSNVKSATLLSYKTSGDTTGDYSQVVGYAAFLLKA